MKNIKRRAARKVIFLLLLLFIGIFIVDISGILRNSLSTSNPIPSQVLICEGWLSTYSYDSIIKVFKQGNYKLLLVTGNPLEENVFLPQNGYIIIKDLPEYLFNSKINSINNITLSLYGSKSGEEYSKVLINKNSIPITDTIELKRNQQISISEPIEVTDSITINFFNDFYTSNSDRNLVLKEAKINNAKINIRSSQVWLKYSGVYDNTSATSFAEKTARELISKGIDKDKVFFIESSSKGLSRTYNVAFDAIHWLKQKGYSSANILTTDFHSKRTYLSYKKVDKDYPIGVVVLPDMSHQRKLKSKIRTAKEIVGCILIRITPRFLF